MCLSSSVAVYYRAVGVPGQLKLQLTAFCQVLPVVVDAYMPSFPFFKARL